MESSSTPEGCARWLEQREWLRALAATLARPGEADDLAQETWLAALRHPHEPAEPRAWLAGIARNLARGQRRTTGRRRGREQRAARAEALPSTAELVERVDAEQRLARELLALREPYRTTLLLRFHEGLGAEEIAARQGVPAGTVRWRTNEGLARLRARLERAFGGSKAFGAALVAIGGSGNEAPPIPPALIGAGGAFVGMSLGKLVVGGALALALAAVAVQALRWSGGSAPDEAAASETRIASLEAAQRSSRPEEAVGLEEGSESDRTPMPAGEPSSPSGSVPARLRILAPDGSPSAGTLVVGALDAGGELAQHTDEAGELGFPARGPCELWIERPGGFPHRTRLDLLAGVQELVVPAGEALEGRIAVVSGPPSRRPIEVELFPAGSNAAEAYRLAQEPEERLRLEFAVVLADAAGRFRVSGLTAEQAYVLRLPRGYARLGCLSVASPESRVTFPVPGPRRGVVFEVERFPSLRGRLVEPDGAPTSGGVDALFRWENGTAMSAGARAGDDGFFELFPGEPWREIELEYFGSPGERGRTARMLVPDAVPADGELGDLRLATGRDLLLRVRDPEGRPIAGAHTRPPGEPTDGRGETCLLQLTAANLRVAARGHREASVDVSAASGTLEVVLERGPEVALAVRDAAGDSPGELLVELEGDRPFFQGIDGDKASTLLSQDRPGRLISWGGRPFRAHYSTDADGDLRIDSLRSGVALVLRVVAPGGLVHEQRIPALGTEEWRRIEVQLEQRAVRVRGRVVDERERPVAGALVALPPTRSQGTGHHSYARADGEGRFDVHVLPFAGARISVSAAGFRRLERELAQLADVEPTLVLSRGRSLGVSVVDELGRTRPGGTLRVREPSDPGSSERPPVAPGRWELGSLGDEELDLELHIGGATYHRKAQPDSEVELRVPVMGSVEIQWDLGEAEAPGWLTIELRGAPELGKLQSGAYRKPRGRQRFDAVLPGRYEAVLTVSDRDEELVLSRREIEVRPDETTTVSL